jgi:hypothetical protein
MTERALHTLGPEERTQLVRGLREIHQNLAADSHQRATAG